MLHKALVGQNILPPTPGQEGVCIACGGEVVAKCGQKNIWHWAHKTGQACDPWWENETEWHSGWKSHFPEQNREVVLFNETTGEKHVADIKTNRGLIIELQHSHINDSELASREAFYGNMIWIVDGEPFKARFKILHKLPDPAGKVAADVAFESSGRSFWRKSENPHHKDPGMMVRIHSMADIAADIEREYNGHHLFQWDRPHHVWFNARKPVFLDFSGDELWRLKKFYADRELLCVRRISKQELIEKNRTSLSESAGR